MTNKEKDKRIYIKNDVIRVKFSDIEKEQIKRKAMELNVSMSDLVRHCLALELDNFTRYIID